MARIERFTDFQNGTTSDAEQLDSELNRIHDLVNGGLDKDNIAPEGVEDANIKDLYGSKIKADSIPKVSLNQALKDEIDAKETIVNSDAKLALKADQATTYTKTEVDGLLTGQDTDIRQDMADGLALKADKSDTYTKSDVDTSLGLKADKSDTYSKSAVDVALGTKANANDVYTKTEVDVLIDGKQRKIVVDSTTPINPVLDMLWIDTSSVPNLQYRYDGTAFVLIGGSGGGGGGSVPINDSSVSTSELWSSSKTNQEINDAKTQLTDDYQNADELLRQDIAGQYEPIVVVYPDLASAPAPSYVNQKIKVGTTNYLATLIKGTADAVPKMTAGTVADGAHTITVTESAKFSTSTPAWKLFDNTSASNTEGWQSGGTTTVANPQWFKVDFGRPVMLSGYALWSRVETSSGSAPKDWKMQGSNDNATWVDVDIRTAEPAWTASNTKRTYNVPDANLGSYQYYRAFFTAAQLAGNAMGMPEAEMYTATIQWVPITESFEAGIQTGSNLYNSDGKAGIDLNNSDIKDANGIYFADISDVGGEGLNFLKTGATSGSTNYADYNNMKVLDGLLYVDSVVFQTGRATITPSAANTATKLTVTFAKPFTGSNPIIQLTPQSGVPNAVQVGVSAISLTTFEITLIRNDTTSTIIHWTAMQNTTGT